MDFSEKTVKQEYIFKGEVIYGNNIKNCEGLFESCSCLEECILNYCKYVENFDLAFRYCESLVKLTIKELNNEVTVNDMFYNIKTNGWYYGTGANDPVYNVIPDTWNKVYDDDNNESQYIKLTYNITDKDNETLKLFCVEKDNFDGETVINSIMINNYKVLDNNISFEFTEEPVEFQVDQNGEYTVKLYINQTFINSYNLIDYLSFYNCNFTEIDFSKLDMSTQKSTVNDDDIYLLMECKNCTSVVFPNNLLSMINFDKVYYDTNITKIEQTPTVDVAPSSQISKFLSRYGKKRRQNMNKTHQEMTKLLDAMESTEKWNKISPAIEYITKNQLRQK